MKTENLENIKRLICEEIQEARSLQDLQGRLDIVQKTLSEMGRGGKRTLYEVKTLYRKDKLY